MNGTFHSISLHWIRYMFYEYFAKTLVFSIWSGGKWLKKKFISPSIKKDKHIHNTLYVNMQMHYFIQENELSCYLHETQRVHSAIKIIIMMLLSLIFFRYVYKRVLDSSFLWLLIRYFIICFIAHLQQTIDRVSFVWPRINNVVKRKDYKI